MPSVSTLRVRNGTRQFIFKKSCVILRIFVTVDEREVNQQQPTPPSSLSRIRCIVPCPASESDVELCEVVHPYVARNAGELTLAGGDVVVVESKQSPDGGWLLGRLRGRRGLFPDNCVRLLPSEPGSDGAKGDAGTSVRTVTNFNVEPPSTVAPLRSPRSALNILENRSEDRTVRPATSETQNHSHPLKPVPSVRRTTQTLAAFGVSPPPVAVPMASDDEVDFSDSSSVEILDSDTVVSNGDAPSPESPTPFSPAWTQRATKRVRL